MENIHPQTDSDTIPCFPYIFKKYFQIINTSEISSSEDLNEIEKQNVYHFLAITSI